MGKASFNVIEMDSGNYSLLAYKLAKVLKTQ